MQPVFGLDRALGLRDRFGLRGSSCFRSSRFSSPLSSLRALSATFLSL
jgi:hypothetical protein